MIDGQSGISLTIRRTADREAHASRFNVVRLRPPSIQAYDTNKSQTRTLQLHAFIPYFFHNSLTPSNPLDSLMHIKQGSGAENSVSPHSGRPVLLWSTMKIWTVYFHFYRNGRPT